MKRPMFALAAAAALLLGLIVGGRDAQGYEWRILGGKAPVVNGARLDVVLR